jgi:FkbM family methyltransferase
MKQFIRMAVRNFGYEVRRIPQHDWLEPLDMLNRLRDGRDGELERFLRYAVANYNVSHAQLFQDLLVLSLTGEKRAGFFVEFGAADGKFLSNTYLLETKFGWNGILAEPSKSWHDRLAKNRECVIERRCVWTATGEKLKFSESSSNDISTISAFKDIDSNDRSHSIEYDVETISLNDLLETNNAPKAFDYLSIDTEGSELTILESLDFAKWNPAIITVEHNFTPARQEIFSLLSSRGYMRIFDSVSRWDDWYIGKDPRCFANSRIERA